MSRVNLISHVHQSTLTSGIFPTKIEVQQFSRRWAGRELKQLLESLPYRKTPIVVGVSLKTNSQQDVVSLGFSINDRVVSVPLNDVAGSFGTVDGPLRDLLSGKAPFPSKLGEDYTNEFVLVSFDMARVALLIRQHTGCHTQGYDLSTILAPNALAPWSPAKVIARRVSDQIDAMRVNGYWDREEDQEAFVMRAWLSQCVGELCTEIKSAISVDTSRLNPKELECLEAMVAEIHRLDQLKPREFRNEFNSLSKRKDGKLELRNDRFKTRVRRSSRQAVVITTTSGREHTTRAVGMRGKTTTLSALNMKNLNDVQSVHVIGRQELTNSERAAEFLLLSVLQGTKSFQKSPFIRLFWFPTWKKFKPPANSVRLDQYRVESVLHSAHLNDSQRKVVETIGSDERSIIVHGPPGTGKTTTIAAISRIWDMHDCPVWIVAHSNVAVKNIANALFKRDVDFKIIVSKEFYEEWHEHLYLAIEAKLIRTDELPTDPVGLERVIGDSCVILSTLSTLSNPALDQNKMFELVPVERLIVDEASQIRVFEFLHLFEKFQKDLEKVYFFGDPCQLSPFNHEKVRTMKTVFDLAHLNTNERRWMLKTQYRMPVQLGHFISQEVYGGQLESVHDDVSSGCIKFVNAGNGRESMSGRSWMNEGEISTVVNLIKIYYNHHEFAVITPYDAQRGRIEKALTVNDLNWKDKVFNLDSFQGNERDYIIISLVRTNEVGFLSNLNRLNVLLTRCKKGMIIVTNRDFLRTSGYHTLVARLANHWARMFGESRTWVDWRDVSFGSADMPGVLGPNRGRSSFQFGSIVFSTQSNSGSARVPARYQGASGGFDTSKLWANKAKFAEQQSTSYFQTDEELWSHSNSWNWPETSSHSPPSTSIETPPRTPSPTQWPSLSHMPSLPKKKGWDIQQNPTSQKYSLVNRGKTQPQAYSTQSRLYQQPGSYGYQNTSFNGYGYTANVRAPTSTWTSQQSRRQSTPTTTITFVNNQGSSATSARNVYPGTATSLQSTTASKLNARAAPFTSRYTTPTLAPRPTAHSQMYQREAQALDEAGWTRVERRKGFGRKTVAAAAKAAAPVAPQQPSKRYMNNRYYWAGR
ncbi:hypothetical protein CC2G_014962 [Coprinopsis cinerea AmutBmut pab1-1]|nr:hypothetical protein CC2G_014962 [Coprinopsis cinerea AmutBmut pab1-1]